MPTTPVLEGKSWTSLMSDYVSCHCGGIRKVVESCPACQGEPYDTAPREMPPGSGYFAYPAFCGAEGRVEDYVLLALMEREWRRPESSAEGSWLTDSVSEKAAVVILYWTYFETRMNRLVQLGLEQLPPNESEELASRYDGVSFHMKELYQILFGLKYRDDLIAVGAGSIEGHLARVQHARNRFVHGEPSALSDSLVAAVVRNLKAEHDAWISVYNRRIQLRASGSIP